MIAKHWKKIGFLAGMASVLGLVSGCFLARNATSPEAVLEGTWQLTGAALEPGVTNFLVSFDDDGYITQVQYTTNGNTVTINGDGLNSTSNVDGTSVSITASGNGGVNNLNFNGTLDSSNNVINGQMSYQFVTDGVTVDSPSAQATLTRQ